VRALPALGLATALAVVLAAPSAFAQHDHGQAAPTTDGPPKVVATFPPLGAVTPAGIRFISVTYDRTMMDKSWSFATGGESKFPEVSGGPLREDDGRTFDLPVNLQPNTTYVIWLNTEKYQNFKDEKGRSAEPYRLTFTTSE
jgi:hypothetical protein